jgi:hypothetical protein
MTAAVSRLGKLENRMKIWGEIHRRRSAALLLLASLHGKINESAIQRPSMLSPDTVTPVSFCEKSSFP